MRRLIACLAFTLVSGIAAAQPVHGIAMHGTPTLPADFKHFPYVNPDVKKGGRIAYGVVGTFDNLNPFILKSMRTTARGMWDPQFGNLVVETLMQRSRDEAFSLYGLLAETVEWDEDRTFIQFNLNPKARWADGQPVTADDVIFSFEILRDKGRAPFSKRLDSVARMEKIGERSVRFTFNEKADRETPLILGLNVPILPKHATPADTFDQSTLTPLVGSGPYKVKTVKPGESIVYERDRNYWGKDLPSKIGFDNYDEIAVEYFLQDATLFEAFKKGAVDIYTDGDPVHWARAYDFPAIASGEAIKDAFKPALPSGMLGFVFNTRRSQFADVKVREALSTSFDFEWANRNLYEGAYTRTQSFWQNSELSSFAQQASDRELELLGPAKAKLPPALLDGSFRLPVSDGSGRDRTQLRKAVDLFKQGGYTIRDGKMVDASGKPLTFEVMTQTPDQEKLAIAWQRSLQPLGVTVSIRTVDDSQYQSRTIAFDYDVIIKSFSSSLSPGIEQDGRWGSAARDRQGSENFAGTADPDLDRMISALLNARSREDFQAAVRAYDRLLLAGNYVVPLYHIGEQWVARRAQIEHPEKVPLYGYQLPVWWDKRAQ